MLRTFPFPCDDARVTVRLEVPLASVCPFDGRRDESDLTVEYAPAGACLEIESFRAYVRAIDGRPIGHEDIARMVFADLLGALHPHALTVRDTFRRDGLTLSVAVSLA